MLFGIPLLYTMEVWWIGAATTPTNMAMVLLFTLGAVLLLVRTAGFHKTSEMRTHDVFIGAVEAVALGVVSATVVLVLLREITSDTPFAVALGKVIYEATPFAIGVAVARHVFSRSRDQSDDTARRSSDRNGVRGTVADLGATFIGAMFIAFNIAPTDEIPMLAAASSPLALLALMARVAGDLVRHRVRGWLRRSGEAPRAAGRPPAPCDGDHGRVPRRPRRRVAHAAVLSQHSGRRPGPAPDLPHRAARVAGCGRRCRGTARGMSPSRQKRTTAEWVVFGVASGIIAVIAASIGWLWLQPYDPAHVTVQQIGEPRVEGSQTYLAAEVTNDGDETAENVQVHAEMKVDDEVVAEGEQIIDFLSGDETEEVAFVFDEMPPNAEVELTVASFKVP